MFILDLRTSLVTASFMCGFMSAIFHTLAKSYPETIGGVREWAVGLLWMAVSALLFAFRDIAPDWASIILGNAFLTVGLLIWLTGTRRFLGLAPLPRGPLIAGLCLEVALLGYWTYAAPHFTARLVMVAAINCLIYFLQAWFAWRHAERNGAARFFIFVMLVGSASMLLRMAASVAQGGAPDGRLLEPTLFQSIYIFFYSLMSLLQAVAFFIMFSARFQSELQKEARTDALTGAWNRRALMEQLVVAVAVAGRKAQEVSAIAMDLDHFKLINDKFGHDVGDAVLRQFSAVVQGQKRAGDIFARVGGEEFVLILPDTSQQSALGVAERIHRRINAPETSPGLQALPPCTASYGVSCRRFDRSSDAGNTGLDTLLKQADSAVYMAKSAGRNRIEMAPTQG